MIGLGALDVTGRLHRSIGIGQKAVPWPQERAVKRDGRVFHPVSCPSSLLFEWGSMSILLVHTCHYSTLPHLRLVAPCTLYPVP